MLPIVYCVRGCMLIEPLANPAFIKAGFEREFFAGEGTGTIQRPVETHAFTKIDHARDQRSREVAEDLLREFLRFLDIDLMILVRHTETSPHAKILAAAVCDITLYKSYSMNRSNPFSAIVSLRPFSIL